jgi:membrane protein DedA with SNARE-associated domain
VWRLSRRKLTMINFWPLLVAMIATHLIAIAIGYWIGRMEVEALRARLETLTDRDARGRFVKREK